MAQNAAKVKLWIFSYPKSVTGDLTQVLDGFGSLRQCPGQQADLPPKVRLDGAMIHKLPGGD
jgi:hypothetical protein